jgi:hypothetical protein
MIHQKFGVQKPLFTIWCTLCGLLVIPMLYVSTQADYELFYIYYQPLIPVLAMLWLWGIVVRYFERNTVKYNVCFSSKDHKYLLNSRQIFQVCPDIGWLQVDSWKTSCSTECSSFHTYVTSQTVRIPVYTRLVIAELHLTCCVLPPQMAVLMTAVALTSAAAFTTHNVLDQKVAAAAHPSLMYTMIIVLLLLPVDIAFKVRILHCKQMGVIAALSLWT